MKIRMIIPALAILALFVILPLKTADLTQPNHAYDVAERFSTLENLEAGDVVVLSETKIDEKIASEALKVDEQDVKDAMKELNVNDASELSEVQDDTSNNKNINSNNLNGQTPIAPGDKQGESANAITGNAVNEIPNAINEKTSNENPAQKIINKLNEKDSEIKTSTGKDKLLAAKAALVKTTGIQNDPNIIGVVSSNPSFVMGFGSELKDTNSVPIALIGRVPVKVSLESGIINVGDPLTSSNKKGYAAKSVNSGRIIGYAMESYNEKSNTEKILVFVQPGIINAAGTVAEGYKKINGSVVIRLG